MIAPTLILSYRISFCTEDKLYQKKTTPSNRSADDIKKPLSNVYRQMVARPTLSAPENQAARKQNKH
jgi:hypothetical protein